MTTWSTASPCAGFRCAGSATPTTSAAGRTRSSKTRHSIRDELDWLDSEGPTSPALIAHLHRAAATCDFIVFFSYRYYHAYHGVRAASSRAVLVPTAERDPALGLATAARTFRNVRALMYNSHEERALIRGCRTTGTSRA